MILHFSRFLEVFYNNHLYMRYISFSRYASSITETPNTLETEEEIHTNEPQFSLSPDRSRKTGSAFTDVEMSEMFVEEGEFFMIPSETADPVGMCCQ